MKIRADKTIPAALIVNYRSDYGVAEEEEEEEERRERERIVTCSNHGPC